MIKTNKISLKTAKKWAKEWRDDEASYNKYFECRAFTIPLNDLKEVIGEGAVAARAYLGVEKTKVEGENVFIEKLMFVGVDKNGKDMITLSKNDAEVLDPDGGDIYDATVPCPEVCDVDSPLNG
ncbi:hypothetical protein FDT66_03130 [Polaribacter aestuariivivens]|uniref:Uncharacterized protein n=1 Tax=Polaribacter aestuariivivens TaxID=2304626 RepID=A0A5S3NBE9_9FLAO|nr:hypothetical protein [Polaribacter aestuariivivens]TMM32472.1 hypothetical protein FDT66_03130 [Polaribacter aestuariivivens]